MISAISNGSKNRVLVFSKGERAQSQSRPVASLLHSIFLFRLHVAPATRLNSALASPFSCPRLHNSGEPSSPHHDFTSLDARMATSRCRYAQGGESSTAGVVVGRDLSLRQPISSRTVSSTETSRSWRHLDFDKAPGHALVLVSWYPATPLTLGVSGDRLAVALGPVAFARDRRSLSMKVCRLCRSQWHVGD